MKCPPFARLSPKHFTAAQGAHLQEPSSPSPIKPEEALFRRWLQVQETAAEPLTQAKKRLTYESRNQSSIQYWGSKSH